LTTAVETLAEASDSEFTATIAGKGPLSDRVEALADAHSNVEYLGYVSEERKQKLLGEGSIFVLPAYAEGLPIAMLEGMAGGNAVVVTSVGSIPDVVSDENGRLVSPGDANELADALAELIADPDLTERMGRRNRELVCQQYSWSAAIDEIEDIYLETVDAPADASTRSRLGT
jgi:glycosyltransferase involved in cell wall biosynthesis